MSGRCGDQSVSFEWAYAKIGYSFGIYDASREVGTERDPGDVPGKSYADAGFFKSFVFAFAFTFAGGFCEVDDAEKRTFT